MRADFSALFEHAHGQFEFVRGGQLPELNRGREAGGATADDHDIEFHRFTFHHRLRETYLLRASINAGTSLNKSPTKP